jgi:hypothetical protein
MPWIVNIIKPETEVSFPQHQTVSALLGTSYPFTIPEYHLNISEKKNLPKPGSVSVLAIKLRNSSALFRKASLMLRLSLSRRR